MDTPAVSENLVESLGDALKASPRLCEYLKAFRPRRCEDCQQPVSLEHGYYFNFVTGQYWHRACRVAS